MSESQATALLAAVQHLAFVSLERRRGEWWCIVQDTRPAARAHCFARAGYTPEAACSQALEALRSYVEANP